MQEPDMYEVAEVLLKEHAARMTRGHKSKFREFISELSKSMGYESQIEDCFLAKNIVVGDPKKADIVLTAHYDTAPNMPFEFVKKQLLGLGVGTVASVGAGILFTECMLNNCTPETMNTVLNLSMCFTLFPRVMRVSFLGIGAYALGFAGGENKKNYDDNTSGVLMLISLMKYYKDLPPELKEKIAFVFFDNEEKGLIGSLCYRAKHSIFGGAPEKIKRVKDQKFINFDCVGLGKRINLFYTGKQVKSLVKQVADDFESRNVEGYSIKLKRSNLNSVSDHVTFANAEGNVMILCDDINEDVVNHIHSKKDTKLVLDNIGFISSVSSETINKILGIDEKRLNLNRGVFKISGQMAAE